MKLHTLLSISLLSLSGLAPAQSPPIEQWKILEGRGLTDNYVYLGMSREEANTRTTNGNCSGNVSQCSFRGQDNPDAPVITLFFNKKNKVTDINFIQGVPIAWPTTAGAVDGMTPEQVQALYPGSVIQQTDPFTRVVVAARQGYRYSFHQVCNSDDQCPIFTYHSVFKRQKAQ
jgi:hypothetical protein